jgi:hypothetical protein
VVVVPKRDVPTLRRALEESLATGRRTQPYTQSLLTRLFRPPAIAEQYERLYRDMLAR